MIHTDKKFIPVMLTPYNHKAAIDFDVLTLLTEYYIASGAKGLFANCLSSEMYELSPEERIAVTGHVVKIANGRVPVLATGTFYTTIQENVDFIKRINDTGVNSVILTTSLLAASNESDAVLEARFYGILNDTQNINFGFYECPLPYKRIISPFLLSMLLRSGRVNYFKDTSLNIEQVTAKIKAGQKYDFGLYDAYMVHAVDSLKAGAAGLSCIQGNYFPELVVWLCDNYNNPDLELQVTRVQAFFRNHMEIMHKYYPTSAKQMLNLRGLNINSFSRSGSAEPHAKDIKKMDTLFTDYCKIEEELLLNSLL